MLMAAAAATALVAVSGFTGLAASTLSNSCREFAILSEFSPKECDAPPEKAPTGP